MQALSKTGQTEAGPPHDTSSSENFDRAVCDIPILPVDTAVSSAAYKAAYLEHIPAPYA